MASDLPCDGDGLCMKCKVSPPQGEVVLCTTCTTPWHIQCLSTPPETMAAALAWECPDCSPAVVPAAGGGGCGGAGDLISSIRAIEADASLTEQDKAKRRQELLSGGKTSEVEEKKKGKGKAVEGGDDVMDLLDASFNCSFCMQLPERPVTTPCGHNFCLKCFQKWVRQGNHTCAKCRSNIPSSMASQPRINATLVVAIRMAKVAKSATSGGAPQAYHFIRNENRPEKAFTTERAKKAGKANAASGQIFVTVAPDHFGPIRAENDPRRNQGVLVGETWEDRMECRQWGAHLPHVAGIAGQADVGAQSVALSGGYQDDEDHGEWFLYTGSGGRDLTGNKRTNKKQSKDQEFSSFNEALRTSCKKGYPVRVVRSHKEKRSSYAPESGVRYDGIYRIEKCWRKVGIQGYKVCRYLFIRCDNEPAPWTSDEYGDRPRPLPAIKELKDAIDITHRKDSPAWDYDEEEGWKWMKTPPISRKPVSTRNPDEKRVKKTMIRAQNKSVQERLLKGFCCLKCRQVMVDPLTTPCAHNFCKSCLMGSYADLSCLRERTRGGRTLRAQKIVKKCPSCPTDISEFLQNPQVNREMMDLIETLKRKIEEENAAEEPSGEGDVEENSSEEGGKLDEDENEGALDIGEGTIAESSSNRKRKKNDEVDVAISNRKCKKSDKVSVAILEKIGEEELPIEGDPKPMEEEELPIEGDPMPMEEEELPIEGDPKPLEAEGDQVVKVANSTLEEELPIEEDPKPMEAEGDQIPVKVTNSTLEEELPIEQDPKPMEAEGDESLVKVANSTPEEELPIEEDLNPMEAEGVQSPVKVANSPTRVESPSSPLHVPQDVDDFQ